MLELLERVRHSRWLADGDGHAAGVDRGRQHELDAFALGESRRQDRPLAPDVLMRECRHGTRQVLRACVGQLGHGSLGPAGRSLDPDPASLNAEVDATWGALPMSELRERFRSLPGQLRGYLTVVPETRWLKHPDNQRFFHDETTAHYEEHRADLEAILAAARG